MFAHYIKLINSFDRLCPQSVLFICQPLNQQQTARCDKCDVGWGGRAGNQKRKEKRKGEKKYIPAACCLSEGWPLRLVSHYWDDLHKKISTLSAAFVICKTLQIRSISPVLKSLLLLILRLNVSLFMPIFCARLVCVKPALAIKPNRRFLLTKLTPPFVLLFVPLLGRLNHTTPRNRCQAFLGRFFDFSRFILAFLGRLCYYHLAEVIIYERNCRTIT